MVRNQRRQCPKILPYTQQKSYHTHNKNSTEKKELRKASAIRTPILIQTSTAISQIPTTTSKDLPSVYVERAPSFDILVDPLSSVATPVRRC